MLALRQASVWCGGRRAAPSQPWEAGRGLGHHKQTTTHCAPRPRCGCGGACSVLCVPQLTAVGDGVDTPPAAVRTAALQGRSGCVEARRPAIMGHHRGRGTRRSPPGAPDARFHRHAPHRQPTPPTTRASPPRPAAALRGAQHNTMSTGRVAGDAPHAVSPQNISAGNYLPQNEFVEAQRVVGELLRVSNRVCKRCRNVLATPCRKIFPSHFRHTDTRRNRRIGAAPPRHLQQRPTCKPLSHASTTAWACALAGGRAVARHLAAATVGCAGCTGSPQRLRIRRRLRGCLGGGCCLQLLQVPRHHIGRR